MRNRTGRARGGFTLIEAAVATAIIGVGATALLVSVKSNTQANDGGRLLTDAVFLAQEIREWSMKLAFVDPQAPTAAAGADGNDNGVPDDIDDLMGKSYCPPRDGQGNAMTGMNSWTQKVYVEYRDPADLRVATAASRDVAAMKVEIYYCGRLIHTANWIAAKR
jgi:prepilin-type N-terminal cleavage/methylation domain-containing protein